MADTTKITLSDKELSLVTDAGWILTKHAIVQKVFTLFAAQTEFIKAALDKLPVSLPPEVLAEPPRIFKGEHYLQLPYVMLDYPRCFNGNDIFAIRTMFWWGNFFSITLHLSGKYKTLLKEKLCNSESLQSGGFYIGVNEDQWQHHFEEHNYLPVNNLSREVLQEWMEQNDFVKIARKYDLHQWNEMPGLLQDGYSKMADLLV